MAGPGSRLDAMSLTRGPGAGTRWAAALLAGLAGVLAWSGAALASCLPIAGDQPRIMPAAFQKAALPAAGEVRLTFLGHSSFLIETPGGATVVTDYNGYVRAPEPPEVVTMNNAHSTHYTDFVEPEIEVVLRGWDPDGGVAQHDVAHRDLRIRNVPTNVRELGGARYNGNSIFVFEVANLCIAHLGHLHHVLTDVHLGELGMIDVLLVPVDGSYTMAQELMVEVIEQIRPSVIIPMHYFGSSTLGRFLGLIDDRYEVVPQGQPTITLSRDDLPYNQVIVLPGG
jgi:L-ascorbate metabolism protein UlaG (beta-lactamase superfamily)